MTQFTKKFNRNFALKFFMSGLLSFILSACTTMLKDPKVNVTRVDLADISGQDITLNLNLSVDNPNAIPINIDKFTYDLSFAGKPVTNGVSDKKVEIAANGESNVTIPVKFKYSNLESLVSGLLKQNLSKDYELNGTAQIGILNIPFNKKGEVDLKK